MYNTLLLPQEMEYYCVKCPFWLLFKQNKDEINFKI